MGIMFGWPIQRNDGGGCGTRARSAVFGQLWNYEREGWARRFLVMKSTKPTMPSVPPDGLPTYRQITGPDDAAFCHRVSDALALGYRLYGPPAATFNGESVIVAQAIVWPSIEIANDDRAS